MSNNILNQHSEDMLMQILPLLLLFFYGLVFHIKHVYPFYSNCHQNMDNLPNQTALCCLVCSCPWKHNRHFHQVHWIDSTRGNKWQFFRYLSKQSFLVHHLSLVLVPSFLTLSSSICAYLDVGLYQCSFGLYPTLPNILPGLHRTKKIQQSNR